jgi:glucose/arabinose dehydrogenase
MSLQILRSGPPAVLPGAILAALLAAACGGDSSPAPQTPATGGGGSSSALVTVTGVESVAWDQGGNSSSELSHYHYLGYVDGTPQVLANATCGTTATDDAFPCTATLPKMSVGLHQLEIAAEEIDGEKRLGPKSPALQLNVVASKTSSVARQVFQAASTYDGIQLVVETLATGLTAPSALAAAPDGRVFAATRDGRIVAWQNGQIRATPAFALDDVAQTSDVGLIGMALDSEFSSNGRVFVAYTARDRYGGFVNRILRLRDVDSVFGEAVVILEDRLPSAPVRSPRIRVGPDHTLYVAFPASDRSTAESFASYAGKILRLNQDGTTPRDNQASTPVISSGEMTTGGFDWQPATGRLWLAGRDWQERDFIRDFLLGPGSAATFDSPVDPSGVAFYTSSRISGFANDIFIGALTGRHLRRVHFSKADPRRIEITEKLLDGQFGRISDVVAAPDGALYLCTNNAGTDAAVPDDDRLLRLIAAP